MPKGTGGYRRNDERVAARLWRGGAAGGCVRPAGVVAAQNRGSPTAPARLTLARARSCPLAGWPGVFPWIRRSRLDIDKWLTEGEPNTALLLHMQGHPFVRAASGKGASREGVEESATTAAPIFWPTLFFVNLLLTGMTKRVLVDAIVVIDTLLFS